MAKIYNKLVPTAETYKAADTLVQKCNHFIKDSKLFDKVDAIITPPSAIPETEYKLVEYISQQLANTFKWTNLNPVLSAKQHTGIKDLPFGKKLTALKDSISIINPDEIKNKTILIFDDLYQSGITLNYIGKLMLDNGAAKVYGLTGEKTLANKD